VFSSMCHLVLFLSRFRTFNFVLRLFNSCLYLLHRLPFLYLFPSIILFRRQFIRKLEPIQITSICFTVHRIFLPILTPCKISSVFTRSVQTFISILLHDQNFLTFRVILIDFLRFPSYNSTKSYVPNAAFY
jgi:hypothetical protein